MSIQATGFLIAMGMVALIWFAFVAPSEREYHDRKPRLLRERIERREQADDEDVDQSGHAAG